MAAERVVVIPEFRKTSEDGGVIYLHACNDGDGPARVFAVDIWMRSRALSEHPIAFPEAEFLRRGERRLRMKSGEDIMVETRRLFWDQRTRPPLFAGMDEPLTSKPIEVPDWRDWLFLLMAIEVRSESQPKPPLLFLQLEPGSGRFIQLATDTAAFVKGDDDDRRWYWGDVAKM